MVKDISDDERDFDLSEEDEDEDIGMPVPVILKNLTDEDDNKKARVIRREQVNLDKIMEGAGTKFYVTGDTVKVGFRELLDLAEKHDLRQVLHLDEEDAIISARLLAGIARSDMVDEEEAELQYIDAAAVGLFVGGFLFGLIGIFVAEISHVHTASWVVLLVSVVMLISYTYQGLRTGFIRKLWKKYLAKMAKTK